MATHGAIPAGQDRRSVHEEHAGQPSGGASGSPSQEAIAARAYALFFARGGVHGDDWKDWLQAEAELRAEGTPATDQAELTQSSRG